MGGLDDESFALFLVELLFQVIRVLRQQPRFGEEREFVFVNFHHAAQILGEIVLASDYADVRRGVDSLKGS